MGSLALNRKCQGT